VLWDCILYNGERDVLDIRMGEIAPLSPHHVVIEATSTFQGEPKDVEPLGGPNLTHVVVDLDVEGCDCGCAAATRFTNTDAWVREAHQRNAAMAALGDVGDDLVILGDVDEVPRAMDVQVLRPDALPVRFLHDAYVFCLDWFGGMHVPGAVVLRRDQITTPAEIRHADMRAVRGGWHFTYMGGKETIERKLRSFSHAELNVPRVRDLLEDAIYEGVVPWNGVQLVPIEGTEHLPEHVQRNFPRFRHMFRKG
jgi:hypothetical protein